MFDDIEVYTNDPTQSAMVPATSHNQSAGIVAVEQSRAVAEAQAAMAIARAVPRDENNALLRIVNACKRQSFAAVAQYAYKRGGTIVTGPSIRMAEVLARHWGNLTYGYRELSRTPTATEVEAYAWDLETNTRVSRAFTVSHVREKKSGNEAITGTRDIYELVANMAQRRVRACILEIIPGDIVERAVSQCNKTLTEGGKPLEDRVRDMITAFSEVGVTPEMVEARLQHKLTAIVPQELVALTSIYRSIRDGIAPREEFFSVTQAIEAPAKPTEKNGKQETAVKDKASDKPA